MTTKQKEKFNNMLTSLRSIATGFQKPSQIQKSCQKEFGLDYSEALEMAYENIQDLATRTIKNIKPIKTDETEKF